MNIYDNQPNMAVVEGITRVSEHLLFGTPLNPQNPIDDLHDDDFPEIDMEGIGHEE